ncbi:MAG: TIGR04283 family arsenosugar biosynthesis glycosyltransferase [Archangium sp.]|nr:TIGR04283 family arsenosugar biosynthesis glycosyltransferase [Archangium sp.]
MSRVAIVIPVLNEERVIAQRLDELAGLDVELLVVDGGSTDGTRALVAARAPRVRLVDSARGRATQLNAGAQAASAPVLLFLHADVALPADALAHVERTLSDARVVAGAFRTWTVADRPTRLGPLLHLADVRSRYSKLPYGDQALFVRAEVFRKLGGFPLLPLMEDLAFSQLLRREGKVRIAPSSVRVSGRRFIAHPLRDTFFVNVFPALFHLGVPPAWLARLYENVR